MIVFSSLYFGLNFKLAKINYLCDQKKKIDQKFLQYSDLYVVLYGIIYLKYSIEWTGRHLGPGGGQVAIL